MAKVGVILSGCGVYDGAEIHESVITLLALDRAGAQVLVAAPDAELDVVDHLSGQPTGEKRKVLAESARIARGEIVPMGDLSAEDIDAVIFPGGFGAAKNLSDFAEKGAEAKAHPEVERLMREMLEAGKPIGLICIAPALAAVVFGASHSPRITIGKDKDTAAALVKLGARHIECPVGKFVVDEKLRIVSTPAYMLGKSIAEVAEGIEALVKKVLILVED